MIINFLAGPGAGKSTLAAGLYYELKKAGIDCELVREYAKDLCWEGKLEGTNPNIITYGQHNLVNKIYGKVPVIVHDTSLLLGALYGQDLETCLKLNSNFLPQLNIFVERCSGYNTNGRLQTLAEAVKIDDKILGILYDNDIPFIRATKYSAVQLSQTVINKL